MAQPNPMVPVPNHPGIYTRGSRYVVVFRVRGAQRKRAFRTLTEARRFKGKADHGEAVSGSREGLIAYAERWIGSYGGRTSAGLAPSTRASYEDTIKRVVVPYFRRTAPSLKLDEVTPSMLRAFIATLAQQGLTPATVRRYFAPLRAMLATAYEDDLLVRNPAAGVRVIVDDERAPKPKRLTPDETRRLLSQIAPEHADLAYLLAATGLRISEALALTWSDYAAGADGPTLTVRISKTNAGRRTIPVSPETGRRLTKRRTASGAPKGAPMFPSRSGAPMDTHNFRKRVFKPAAEAAGVAWATPHALRHGMASLMADHGYSAAQIAAHLGHADGGVLAMRTYITPAMIEAPAFVDDALGTGN